MNFNNLQLICNIKTSFSFTLFNSHKFTYSDQLHHKSCYFNPFCSHCHNLTSTLSGRCFFRKTVNFCNSNCVAGGYTGLSSAVLAVEFPWGSDNLCSGFNSGESGEGGGAGGGERGRGGGKRRGGEKTGGGGGKGVAGGGASPPGGGSGGGGGGGGVEGVHNKTPAC